METAKACTGSAKHHLSGSALDVESKDLLLECSEAKPNLCPATDKTITHEPKVSKTPEELYRALTDKNRAIELLKRRLTNQQIQLGYYLHKNLATEAVLEFSNKCFPHLAEDSTQLSLAMYKFIRDTGGKTRLAQLREKLTDYNNRVHKALLRQEQLIRQGYGFGQTEEVLNKNEIVCNNEDQDQSESDDFRFAKKYYKSAKLEMCSQLLSITLLVRKELERFRACAENVVKLEEERNALVDRVFSLPADQRYGTLHVSMVDRVCKIDSANSLRSITSISTATNTTTEAEGKTMLNNLGGALRDMESEAIQLLLLSEKQQHEFVIALEEARVENQQLRERLRDLEDAASDERVLQLQEKCNSIEQEVETMRKDLEAEHSEKEQVIRQMASQLDNKEVSEKNTTLEIKRLKASIELLRTERDILQKKLEYKKRINIMNQNTSTDDMLEVCSDPVSQQDVDDLTDLVVMQEEQIKDLLSIMSDLNLNDKDSTISMASTTKKSTIPEDKDDSPEDTDDHLEDADDHRAESVLESNDSGILSPQIPEQTKPEPAIEIETHDEEYHIYYDSASDFSHQDVSDDGRMIRSEGREISKSSKSSKSKGTIPEKVTATSAESRNARRPRSRSLTARRSFNNLLSHKMSDKHREGIATTSLRVQAFDKDGKSESMHAVLECSAPVDGVLEMNNSSKLHLRLHCTSPHRSTEYAGFAESSQYYEKFSGDHPSPTGMNSNNENRHLSREAKVYLSRQLNKIKSQLETSKSSINTRKEIVQNLNEIYSQLFGTDDEIVTQSSRS